MVNLEGRLLVALISALCLDRPRVAVNYAASSKSTIQSVFLDADINATVEQWRQDRRQHDAEIRSWKRLPADRYPTAVIVDIEDRQIGGLNIHHQHGHRRECVSRIYAGALSPAEVADYVAATYRYADAVGIAPAMLDLRFRRLWSSLRGDSWEVRRRIGPERAPFDIACRPWWARRLRFAMFGIGRWDHVAPTGPLARVLTRLLGFPAGSLLLNDDDYDAFEFIGWVRRGWRPTPALIQSITDVQRLARLERVEGARAMTSSPLRRQADALWLAVYFKRGGELFLPRKAPASRSELRELI